jgi:hypothetical protein
MAGLGSATRVFTARDKENVGARAKRGHDTWVNHFAAWYHCASAIFV